VFISREKIRKHRRWWLFFCVWTPLAIFAVVWFGFPPHVQEQAVRAERDANGNFVETALGDEAEPENEGLNFEANLGQISANNNISTVSSVSSGNPAFFLSKNLILINQSDHLLMRRVGDLLFEQLQQSQFVDRIEYFPSGSKIPEGHQAPDIFIQLDLKEIEESRLLVSHGLEATIQISAMNNYARSHSTYNDHLTPPRIQFAWRSTLDHKSTTTDVGTSSSKYKLAAENIAKEIGGKLTKQFDEWTEKYGMSPTVPDVFYPDYRQAEPLPILEEYQAKLQFSGHGLYNRNQSVWSFQSDSPPEEVIRSVATKLAESGWDVPKETLVLHKSTGVLEHLRAKKGNIVLEVFPAENSRSLVRAREERQGRENNEPYLYYVTYTERLSREELRELTQTLFDEELPAETVLLLHNVWRGDEELRKRTLEFFEAGTIHSPAVLLAKANILHDLKQTDAAQEALNAAYLLSELIPDPSSLKTSIKNLAETMELDEFPPETFTDEFLQRQGLIELTPETRISDIEIDANQPVYFYCRDDGEPLRLISYQIKRGKADQWQIAHVLSTPEEGMREWGTNGSLKADGAWSTSSTHLSHSHNLRFYVRRTAESDRFEVAADLVDPQQPAPPPPYE